MAGNGITLAAYWRLVRGNRNFRLLWIAQIVSEIGDWFYSVAIFSFLLAVTGSAQTMAFAFVLQVLPQTFAAPTAGVINDRISRRHVLMFADWTRAVIVLAMLLVQSKEMVWLLYILLFLETVMWALFEPGRSAILPNIATEEEVVVANALSSTTWSFNFAVGAALGGMVAAFFGRPTVFVLNAVSFVVSALCIRQMKFAEPHAENLPPLSWRDLVDFRPIMEGVRYVTRDIRLAVTMLVKGGLSLMGTNWVILPILGERVFRLHAPGLNPDQAGTLGMSTLLASRGVGAIVGAFVSSRITGGSPGLLRKAILAGFLLGAFGYISLSAAPSLWLACLAVGIAHAGGSIIWVSSTTLLQQRTEDRFRGRVFSAEFAISMLTLAAVSFAAGGAVDRGMTAQQLSMLTGAVMLAPAIAWLFALRLWQGVDSQ